MIFTELRAVAFVEDKDHPLVSEWFEPFFIGLFAFFLEFLAVLAVFIEGKAEFLDGGDDDLVGVVIGEQAADKRLGIGVLFDTVLLELIKLLARLPIQVLAVYDEEALFDLFFVFEQGGGLEGSQSLATSCGVPDVAVAAVLTDAVHDGFDGVDLVGAHHQELLLAGDENHIAANHSAECALSEELLSEIVEVCDFLVVYIGILVDW